MSFVCESDVFYLSHIENMIFCVFLPMQKSYDNFFNIVKHIKSQYCNIKITVMQKGCRVVHNNKYKLW